MPPGAAACAQANAQIVSDYYAKLKTRDGQPYLSYDGKGSPLKSFINDNGDGFDNAFWWKGAMHCGDGLPDKLVFPSSASLDFVAHEITHGVTEHTSRLVHIDNAQPNAIDESLSD